MPAGCWPPARPRSSRRAPARRRWRTAFIALLPEERRARPPAPAHPAAAASADGEPAIEADGLTRRFGAFTAVDHVNFAIERGEIFGFLGSNGCGKTTTMKMLTGLLPATEGEARLFGRPVDARDLDARRRVGYMSQAFSLYSELTVRQNLDLHARLFHLPRAKARDARRRAGRAFGLERACSTRCPRRCRSASASASRSPWRCSTSPSC